MDTATNPIWGFGNVYKLGNSAGHAIAHFWWAISASNSSSTTCGGSGDTLETTSTSMMDSGDLLQQFSRIIEFPALYKEWWFDLLANNPMHVIVETTLLVSLVYIFISRSNDWRDNDKEKLTSSEQNELLNEWKQHTRASLTPQHHTRAYENYHHNNNKNSSSSNGDNDDDGDDDSVVDYEEMYHHNPADDCVIHKVDGRLMDIELLVPTEEGDEVIVKENKNVKKKKKDNNKKKDKNKNKKKETTTATETTTTTTTVKKSQMKTIRKTVLNFATFDFLGRSAETLPPVYNNKDGTNNEKEDKEEKKVDDNDATSTKKIDVLNSIHPNPMKQAALYALDKYGCGSCGPRGFYGTIDVHLQLEKQFADHMNCDDAILYSDGASTCSSTVAAFCKRGDLIIADRGISEPLITGLTLSRAHVKWFEHNNVDDLKRVLQQVQKSDEKLKRKPSEQKRFLLIEGLYKNTGKICPLEEICALKHQYHYRLILDESMSFGTLGKTGGGVTELHSKKSMYDIEITTATLENSVGSIGGMSVGSTEIVNHQRLSGSGYCYSASSPPFAASAAMHSIDLLKTRPDILERMHNNRQYFINQFNNQLANNSNENSSVSSGDDEKNPLSNFVITSDELSPLIFLQVRAKTDDSSDDSSAGDDDDDDKTDTRTNTTSSKTQGDTISTKVITKHGDIGDNNSLMMGAEDCVDGLGPPQVADDVHAHYSCMYVVRELLMNGIAAVATGPPVPPWIATSVLHQKKRKALAMLLSSYEESNINNNKKDEEKKNNKNNNKDGSGSGGNANNNNNASNNMTGKSELLNMRTPPPVGIRFTISASHTLHDIDHAIMQFKDACKKAKEANL